MKSVSGFVDGKIADAIRGAARGIATASLGTSRGRSRDASHSRRRSPRRTPSRSARSAARHPSTRASCTSCSTSRLSSSSRHSSSRRNRSSETAAPRGRTRGGTPGRTRGRSRDREARVSQPHEACISERARRWASKLAGPAPAFPPIRQGQNTAASRTAARRPRRLTSVRVQTHLRSAPYTVDFVHRLLLVAPRPRPSSWWSSRRTIRPRRIATCGANCLTSTTNSLRQHVPVINRRRARRDPARARCYGVLGSRFPRKLETPLTDRARIHLDISAFLLLGMHLAVAAVFFVPVSWNVVALALGSYLLRMFAITAGNHRYFSHRSFKTSRAFQLVLAVLEYGRHANRPFWWASWHRRHHKRL